MARLKEQYVNEIAPALNKKFGYKSVMQIPKLDKVIINVAAGEAKENAKVIDAIVADLGQITGQKAIVCKARKSVANFKLREGMPIGAKVTLRGERMYEFVDRLFNVALPRVRDFRGINGNSFDGRGNYAFGLKEQIIFPEIDFDKVDAIRGMDICFVTTAKTDEEAKAYSKEVDLTYSSGRLTGGWLADTTSTTARPPSVPKLPKDWPLWSGSSTKSAATSRGAGEIIKNSL